MTTHSLYEIEFLINEQTDRLTQLKLAFEVVISEDFLSHSKSVIHSHLCIIDDKFLDLLELNKKILNYFAETRKE